MLKFLVKPLISTEVAKAEKRVGEFKIFKVEDILNLSEVNLEDSSPNHTIGSLTINDPVNPKDFDFNGSGKISGEDLVELTEQIIEHYNKI